MRFSLRNARPADGTVPPGICMYGRHQIPAGEPFIAIDYSQVHTPDGVNVDVEDTGTLLFACMRHAPSEDEVIAALRAAGIPVEG